MPSSRIRRAVKTRAPVHPNPRFRPVAQKVVPLLLGQCRQVWMQPPARSQRPAQIRRQEQRLRGCSCQLGQEHHRQGRRPGHVETQIVRRADRHGAVAILIHGSQHRHRLTRVVGENRQHRLGHISDGRAVVADFAECHRQIAHVLATPQACPLGPGRRHGFHCAARPDNCDGALRWPPGANRASFQLSSWPRPMPPDLTNTTNPTKLALRSLPTQARACSERTDKRRPRRELPHVVARQNRQNREVQAAPILGHRRLAEFWAGCPA